MSISVDRDNIPAINLYKKVGFKIKEPITQLEIEDDENQFIMEAKLDELFKD
ncbi:MAG: hypothetical protein IJW82_00255 [Clostridia bacterium]|nr:hypothetical protein [Clostridia bacterium]